MLNFGENKTNNRKQNLTVEWQHDTILQNLISRDVLKPWSQNLYDTEANQWFTPVVKRLYAFNFFHTTLTALWWPHQPRTLERAQMVSKSSVTFTTSFGIARTWWMRISSPKRCWDFKRETSIMKLYRYPEHKQQMTTINLINRKINRKLRSTFSAPTRHCQDVSPGVSLCQRSSVFTSEDHWQRLPNLEMDMGGGRGGGGGRGVKFWSFNLLQNFFLTDWCMQWVWWENTLRRRWRKVRPTHYTYSGSKG